MEVPLQLTVMCCRPPLAVLLAAAKVVKALRVTLAALLQVTRLGRAVAGVQGCKGCCRQHPACLLVLQLAQR
jgi:hypothetical protein